MLVHLAHGAGNDFVVIEDRDDVLDVSPDLVRALCDRRTGVGADGMIRLAPSDRGMVFMDYRNADGTVSQMCGNGIRVVARMIVDLGWADADEGGLVTVDTRGGLKPVTIRRVEDGAITVASVDMGPDDPDPAASGFDEPLSGDPHALVVDGRSWPVGLTSMGNPHVVLVVVDVDSAPVTTLGPRIETDPRWQHGVNVSFLQPTSRTTARLRVWERGVGETQACGSGTCAAHAVGRRLGLLDDRVVFDVPGGELLVTRSRDGAMMLEGPVEVVGSVELDPRWVARTGAA